MCIAIFRTSQHFHMGNRAHKSNFTGNVCEFSNFKSYGSANITLRHIHLSAGVVWVYLFLVLLAVAGAAASAFERRTGKFDHTEGRQRILRIVHTASSPVIPSSLRIF